MRYKIRFNSPSSFPGHLLEKTIHIENDCLHLSWIYRIAEDGAHLSVHYLEISRTLFLYDRTVSADEGIVKVMSDKVPVAWGKDLRDTFPLNSPMADCLRQVHREAGVGEMS